jgi:hypothetical protein
MTGKPKWMRYIDEELDWYRDHGISPKQIILGIDLYQELMAWLAAEDGRDDMEPHIKWQDCLLAVVKTPGFAEVGGDLNEVWENGAAFGMSPEAAKTIPVEAERDEWAL